MKPDYPNWLIQQQYDAGTITAQLHRAGRVEKHYGDLDEHYAADHLQSVIDALRYTTDDKRHNRLYTSKIPFDGDVYSNLASVMLSRAIEGSGMPPMQRSSPQGP
jgi:hypothetical protein